MIFVIILLWAWPCIGVAFALAYAVARTWDDNVVIRFIAVCLGILAGIVLGPFAISLFIEARKRDEAQAKGHTG